MIQSVKLTNFQAHKNTRIDFCNGVNAIVGFSDSGKSSVLRAIRWVLTNKPTGSAFISNWAVDAKGAGCEVQLVLSDRSKVTRGRTKTDNYYRLETDANEGALEFRAFGQEVPHEIEEVLNLNDINVQAQLDAPFLLSASPGEVAQTLNRVVNLDVIDTAVASIRKEKMHADQELKTAETRLVKLGAAVSEFDYLEQMEKEVSQVEKLNAAIEKTKQQCNNLRTIVNQAEVAFSRVETAKSMLVAESDIDKAGELQSCIQAAKKYCSSLRVVLGKLKKATAVVESSPDYNAILAKVAAAIETSSAIKKKKDEINALDKLVDDICTQNETIDYAEKTLKGAAMRWPKVCPLCGK